VIGRRRQSAVRISARRFQPVDFDRGRPDPTFNARIGALDVKRG